ncbi:uncharacterized protein H6S33_008735 [Morchella sextelata]|uniref:uncharacterized protein n=1 Tax=Morchella sextelata TaxID=1174677 RepID=UPI001D047684|nr:uncharacterized protein H6S33_008735 [Morchella sextelata]KAH0602396.1 hypothetical protein H6S33_008735 [Morchella sextelata]
MSSPPIQPTSPKQTIYEIPSTAPRLSLRKCIDKIANFLKVHDICWAGIELEPTTANGQLSPGTGPSAPAGKVLRVYAYDSEDPVAVSYLFQQSGFVKEQLPEGIEVVEFVGLSTVRDSKEKRAG